MQRRSPSIVKRLPPSFFDDPYPTYHALRTHDPIHRMPDGSYFLTRYDDCVAIYRDAATWSSDKKVDFRPNFADSLLYEHHTTSLVFNDPPYHARVRKLLAPAFTPRALKALQPRIEALVDRLLDRAAERGGMDVIDDFAAAIPVQLIGDMLGIPQDERGPLRAWSLAILGALEPVLSPAQFETGVTAVADFKAYLRNLVARRVAEGSGDEAEILSTLIAGSEVAAQSGEGELLSEAELLHNCIFLLNAGHETTTNLIGNAVDLLLRFPEALDALRAEPDLIEPAVEEFLRMESSNQLGNRRAARDTALGGVALPAGAMSTSASAPRTAIRRSFRSPTGSTSGGSPTAISPSAPASMPAPACRSPAWRRRSRSAVSCSASPGSSARGRRSAAGGRASAASCTTRCESAGLGIREARYGFDSAQIAGSAGGKALSPGIVSRIL